MATRLDKETGMYYFEYHINKGKPNAIRGYSKPIYKKEIDAKLAEEKDKETKRNPYGKQSEYTLNDIINIYVEGLSGLKGQTINKKKQTINKYILINTDDEDVLTIVKPLDLNKRINDFHIQEFRNWRNQIASLNLQGKYINGKILSMMRNILEIAIKECGLESKFLDAVNRVDSESKNRPRLYSDDDNEVNPYDLEENFWTPEEFEKFIKVVDDPKYNLLFQTLYWTGIRVGELRALKFREFRIIDGEYKLSIYNTYTDDNIKTGNKKKDYEAKLTSVKTKNSRRNISLNVHIVFGLLNYRNECMKEDNYSQNNFMFFNGVDIPISYNAIYSAKEKYVKLAGVKNISVHGFRHSRASYLINTFGSEKITSIAYALGHSVNECLETYSHYFKKDMKEIIEKSDLSLEKDWYLVHDGYEEDGSPISRLIPIVKDYIGDNFVEPFGIKIKPFKEDELTEEEREIIKETENFDPSEIEYVSKEELYAFLNGNDNDEEE